METGEGDALPAKYPVCTDPTYKEWKRGVYEIALRRIVFARILPTRNGNVGRPARLRPPDAAARILPTRNGNHEE